MSVRTPNDVQLTLVGDGSSKQVVIDLNLLGNRPAPTGIATDQCFLQDPDNNPITGVTFELQGHRVVVTNPNPFVEFGPNFLRYTLILNLLYELN